MNVHDVRFDLMLLCISDLLLQHLNYTGNSNTIRKTNLHPKYCSDQSPDPHLLWAME